MSALLNPEVYLWIAHSLYWIGIVLACLGLALILIPHRLLGAAQVLNRWVSTKSFFEDINRPRYVERGFYRHHRFAGSLIILLSAACLYMLTLYEKPVVIKAQLVRTVETEFGAWLVVSGYYLLVVCLVIALLAGIVVLLRPSLLKSAESWGNRWIDVDRSLETLDRVHEVPSQILPGRPRWFGLFVLLGALYIIFTTGRVLS